MNASASATGTTTARIVSTAQPIPPGGGTREADERPTERERREQGESHPDAEAAPSLVGVLLDRRRDDAENRERDAGAL